MPEPSFAALRSLGAYFQVDVFHRGMLVEQQIVLNSKGAADGTLRICIDEKLRIENRSLIIKSDSSPGFSCVVARYWLHAYGGRTGDTEDVSVCCIMAIAISCAPLFGQPNRGNSAILVD